MKSLPEFKLETYLAKWEFKAKHHMTASDAQSMSMRELLAMATDTEREEFENLWLGYTETFGAPDLLAAIAQHYKNHGPDHVLTFAGASEAIFAANRVLLDADSHAIAITPNYQSHESLPLSICETTGVALDYDKNWILDIDKIESSIRPNTKLLTINFPHNPTGAILSDDCLNRLVELCRMHGIYIFSDEIFNGLGRTGTRHMPYIADVYEKGLSLNVMSKAYGLPGLRIGWIVTEDKDLLARMERVKHYLSICNSGPSERLTKIALNNRERIFNRNCKIIDENLVQLNAFLTDIRICLTGRYRMDHAWHFHVIWAVMVWKTLPGSCLIRSVSYCCLQAFIHPAWVIHRLIVFE